MTDHLHRAGIKATRIRKQLGSDDEGDEKDD